MCLYVVGSGVRVFVCCGVRIHTQCGVCGPVCVNTYCGVRFTSGGQMQMVCVCVCAHACGVCVCGACRR